MRNALAIALLLALSSGVAYAAEPDPGGEAGAVFWIRSDYASPGIDVEWYDLTPNGHVFVTADGMLTTDGSSLNGHAYARSGTNWYDGTYSVTLPWTGAKYQGNEWDATTDLSLFIVGQGAKYSDNAGNFANGANYESWSYTSNPPGAVRALNMTGAAGSGWMNLPNRQHISEYRVRGGLFEWLVDGNVIYSTAFAGFGADPTARTFFIYAHEDFGGTGGWGLNPDVGDYGYALTEAMLFVDNPIDSNAVGVYLQDRYGIEGGYALVVPEPAGLGLLGIALLGLRRRRS